MGGRKEKQTNVGWMSKAVRGGGMRVGEDKGIWWLKKTKEFFEGLLKLNVDHMNNQHN